MNQWWVALFEDETGKTLPRWSQTVTQHVEDLVALVPPPKEEHPHSSTAEQNTDLCRHILPWGQKRFYEFASCPLRFISSLISLCLSKSNEFFCLHRRQRVPECDEHLRPSGELHQHGGRLLLHVPPRLQLDGRGPVHAQRRHRMQGYESSVASSTPCWFTSHDAHLASPRWRFSPLWLHQRCRRKCGILKMITESVIYISCTLESQPPVQKELYSSFALNGDD